MPVDCAFINLSEIIEVLAVVHLPPNLHEYYHVVTGKLSISIPTYMFLIKQALTHNYYCNM
jgi:hypothetical protein